MRFFRPSSGAQNCTYSVRYLSDRYCYPDKKKMEGHCSTGQSPQWALVSMEEEEEEEEEDVTATCC